ncbi:MAG TPA: patatin-like phospholipase family protein [Steroidobacteraceae bacterium]|nr:patatin-like phospholipase family protein [Steroidobacteraceae bacterium]
MCAAQAADPATAATTHRPRIGLVLGGGGARGAAHIGVLHVLEDLRIPIDCVAGTSMGSLVGAAYASGMTSGEIEKLVKAINWSETFGTAGTRALQPVSIKTANPTYSNKLEFGVKGNGLLAPAGLMASQQIESILRSIVGRARYHESFDGLPIPFRAIATDIGSGEMMILEGGDLAVAMRASMAVPGAFAPVTLDDRVLVDGGLVRNLPVDVARNLCADVIIASSLVSPEPTAESLQSALGVVSQMVDLMVKNNERAQLATLRDGDIPILITLPNIGSGDFDKVPAAIPLGEDAARAVAPRLAHLGVSQSEYAQWRARIEASAVDTSRRPDVSGIHIAGLKRTNPDVVSKVVKTHVGQPLDEAKIVGDAQRIFARGDFESVDYRVDEEGTEAQVTFLPKEKSWGPNYLRFDLGLMSSLGGDTGFVLRADHTRTWVNSLGGRWESGLQVGSTTVAETALFQPLDLRQSLFVEPSIRWRRDLQDLYDRGDRVARYKFTALDVRLDGGIALGNWGEWRVGARAVRSDVEADTGDKLLPEVHNLKSNGWTSRFVLDTRDSPFIPTRGSYVDVDLFAAEPAFGSDDSYQRARLLAQHVVPVRGDLLYLQADAGSDFGSDLPAHDLFTLGGASQFAGFESDELRGREYAMGRIAYLRKVTDLQTLLGQALYAGVSLEAGNMYERIDEPSNQDTIFGSSLFFGGRTPIGPLVITFGYAEGGHKSAYVQLGRPLQER